ncbi:hypothetical protein PCC7424_5360 (plasmid) [Gloeothece citriformis PCC 7424]|uniref:Uncharacterized protein n=1 Tax=Gloeothece citriformis (strain PCC 7424) TaxID=65393 RepID=B7KMC1_GLOC7|nr:hypothetical protein [Gloeothece citriformis]ACK73943.1 hypothetical protein PCC7424_5360 [Gloeothece citriformis PCC 7424]
MGLTIHYSFKTDTEQAFEAYQLIERLHQFALTLPFMQVNSIVELNENEVQNTDATDPLLCLKIHAAKTKIVDFEIDKIYPISLIGFTIYAAQGCEELDIFLGRYSDSHIWEAHSFCKTQYAALEEYGGILNFIKVHTSIVLMLDEAQKLGILEEVVDESHYWEDRNLKKLIEEIMIWQGLTSEVGEILGEISRNSSFNYLN